METNLPMDSNREDELKESPRGGPRNKALSESIKVGPFSDAGFGFQSMPQPQVHDDSIEGGPISEVGTTPETGSLEDNRKRSAACVRRVNRGSSLHSGLSDSSSSKASKKKKLSGGSAASIKKETMTRKRYGNQLKHDVLQFLKSTNMNYEQVALKFDVSVSALRDWRKREVEIKRSVEEKRGTMKSNPHYFLKKINDSVMHYYNRNGLAQKNKRPISAIRKKALEVRERLLSKHQRNPFLDDSEVEAITSFKASSSWAVKLVIRHKDNGADTWNDDDDNDDEDDMDENDDDDNRSAVDLDSDEIKEKFEDMCDFMSKYGHLIAVHAAKMNLGNAGHTPGTMNISDDLRVLKERVDSLEAKLGAMLQTQQEIMMALRG